ncbi:MAG: 5'-3' exonuclease [Candidatus Calescibacterium sp.]|nr:5'-3' exonuclease [Candidatus Calescibacterium sp.]MDW8132202.1 5'-3' exonuclease [Candidatus Calescibacterium sp.]
MLFLIDTYSILYRLFFALPKLSYNGIQLNSIYGISKLMIKLTKQYRPKYLAFCIDKGRSNRNEVIKEYKMNRKPTLDEFKQQIPIFYEFANSAGFMVYGIDNLEADDVIFTLTRIFKNQSEIYVLTGDKDLLQVIDDNVNVLLMKKGITDIDFFNYINFEKEFGFCSKFYPYYKALVGDPSDNIKGVKGIGPKKATQILKNIQSLEEIYKHLSPSETKIFNDNLSVIILKDYSKNLKIEINLDDLKVVYDWYKNEEFVKFLKNYSFVSILNEVEDKQLKLF